MSLSINFTPTLADYVHFDQASINFLTTGDVSHNGQFRDQVYGLIFVLLFLAVVAIIAALVNVTFSVISFAAGILFYIFITRYKVRQLRRKLTPSPDCSLFAEHDMSLDEAGIVLRTSLGSTSVSWEIVTAVQEDSNYFYVFLDSLRGIYIPKRELVSASLQQEIRIFFKENVGKIKPK